MKKALIIVLMIIVCNINVSAQISTITIKNFNGIGRPSTSIKDYYFKKGENVIIHAYKKKSDSYHFLIEADDYANLIETQDIPFDVDEKELKKLPNALGSKCEELRLELIQKVLNSYREKALDGQITAVISRNNSFVIDKYGKGEIIVGDTVHILGCTMTKETYGGYNNYYALYTNAAAGIYRLASGELNSVKVSNMPSVHDEQVMNILHKKIEDLIKKEKEFNEYYQNEAVKGNIKIVVNDPKRLKCDNYGKCPFAEGDTLTLVGYSKGEGKYYYALYSDKGAGIFEVWERGYEVLLPPFKYNENIKFSCLPSVSNDLVKNVISKKSERVDSLLQEKKLILEQKIQETHQSIINSLKVLSPICIKDISWTSNSVGGITLNLEVTNCSLQTIKYITFNGYFENPVGDKCQNEVGGGRYWKLKGIGPIGPRPTTLDNYEERFNGCVVTYNFDNPFFYSRIADSLYISSVTIQYMDGKTITLSGANLDKHVRY